MNRREIAEKYFVENGLMPAKEDRKEKWVLHHKNPELKLTDHERYELWNIEDLVPLTQGQHNSIHAKLQPGIYGHEHTDEERVSQSKVLADFNRKTKTGIKLSDSHKLKISQTVKENWQNPEFKEKMSNRNCISSSNCGYVKKTEKNSTGRVAWNKGKHLSDELRNKISESSKGRIPWNKGLKMNKENLMNE